jgi:hypothetical protein
VPEPDADIVRLSLPADDELRPVVEVIVSVLARRWGLSEDEVVAVRAAAGDALGELALTRNADPVLIEVHASPHHLEVQLSHAGTHRAISAPLP